jgi:hypothetical protein
MLTVPNSCIVYQKDGALIINESREVLFLKKFNDLKDLNDLV